MVDKSNGKRELKPVSKNNLLNKIMYKSHKNCTENTKKRINEIILSLLIRDVDSLRKFSFEGLPDEMPLLRSLLWKINLKYLGMNLDKWEDYLNKKRAEYNDMKSAFMMKLQMEYQAKVEIDNNSNIEEYQLTDKKLLEDIDKDIKRTHTYMHFFFMPSKKSLIIPNEEIAKVVEKKRQQDCVKSVEEIYKKIPVDWETNGDVLSRILFIYAKLNEDVGYVQGMNEILAPIYYCFFSEEENSIIHSGMDELDLQKEQDYFFTVDVEADTFWTFTILMEEIKILFIKDKDKTSGGIFSKLNTLNELLKIVDKDLFNHFKKIKVDIQLFAFKWVVLLFTQDFLMPDILRIWDAILSEEDKFYMVYLICLSILILKRKEILKGDFSVCIAKLQKINNIDCELLLLTANDLKKKYDKKLKKVLNSIV